MSTVTREGGSAQQRWAAQLEAWAIPQAILDNAPESPWGFPPSLFAFSEQEETLTHRRALEGLPRSGSVLDVGAGGGATSLALARRAAWIVAVDESEAMLESFAREAERLGVGHEEILGSWPEVSPRTPHADVVVCGNVFYNAPLLAPFALALGRHARVRVVAEVTARHPQVALNDFWRHFHGLDRPAGPRCEDALEVLVEAGIDARLERWRRPLPDRSQTRQDLVAFVRRRLCLHSERDPEIDELLGERAVLQPGDMTTLWWDV
ncbi:MAG TPA: class I SAM-dependent methyltransferase [Actinomycetota bacterium]|nr:class I SAM-dependent methyltransferase [Actinomycetota bacterium]